MKYSKGKVSDIQIHTWRRFQRMGVDIYDGSGTGRRDQRNHPFI